MLYESKIERAGEDFSAQKYFSLRIPWDYRKEDALCFLIYHYTSFIIYNETSIVALFADGACMGVCMFPQRSLHIVCGSLSRMGIIHDMH
jgi:hypothetical protein